MFHPMKIDLFARNKIAEVHGEGVSQENVIISSSGANAFYSLFIIHINFLLKEKKDLDSTWLVIFRYN